MIYPKAKPLLDRIAKIENYFGHHQASMVILQEKSLFYFDLFCPHSESTPLPPKSDQKYRTFASQSSTPIFDASKLWPQGSKLKTLFGHHQAS